MNFIPGHKHETLNAFGKKVCWVGRWTEYEYALWLKCETEAHLRECLDFQVKLLHEKIAVATAKDHGWPKTMPWNVRLLLFRSDKNGWTPKRHAQATINMNVRQVMKTVRDLQEWIFAHES